MIQKDYAKLLRREEWKSKRIHILIRDSFTCTCCNKKKDKLYIHHKYYKAYPDGEKVLPWEYSDDALTTLCYHCHRKAHLHTKVFVRYILRT